MPIEISGDEWLSTGEAAAVLGVRSGTVSRWIRDGRLRGERQSNGWIVARREVSALLKAGPGAGRRGGD